jgi:hypothetical protein
VILVYRQNELEADFEEIYQDIEGPPIFNIEATVLPDSPVGDIDDVIVPQKGNESRRRKYRTRESQHD